MTTIDQLREASTNMMANLADHPTLSLAVATAWLNPLHIEHEDEDFDIGGFYGGWDEQETRDIVRFALRIASACLPKLFVELVAGMASGWDYAEVGSAFCAGVKKVYPHIPMGSIFDVTYGIPMEFWGMGWYTSDAEMPFDHLVELVRDLFWFNEDNEDPDQETLHDVAWPIAKALIRSLILQDRQPYADLALLFLYLFSATNESLMDLTEEDYMESGGEYIGWTTDNLIDMEIAYIHKEIILAAKDRALDIVDHQVDIRKALQDNIEIIREAIEAGEDAFERKDIYGRLTWPERDRTRCTARSYLRAAGADAGLLFIRSYFNKD